MSMGNEVTTTSPLIGSGVAAQALDGTAELGDQYLLEPCPSGLQVAVMDGVGHGDRAVAGAKTAVAALESHAHKPITLLLKRCHEELRGTRGMAISLTLVNALVQYGRGMDDALVLVACTIGDLSRAQTRGALWTTSCTN
jgi:hypothetical protein